jgi:hypothetical protein
LDHTLKRESVPHNLFYKSANLPASPQKRKCDPSPTTPAPPTTTGTHPRRRLLPVEPHHHGQAWVGPHRPPPTSNGPLATPSCPSHHSPSAIAADWPEPAGPLPRRVYGQAPLLFSNGLPAHAEPAHVLGRARSRAYLSPRCTVHLHLFQ